MESKEEEQSLEQESSSSPENYLYFLTTVNPTDFINTSERGSKIVKLFSEQFLPLPFSSNEDGSDLTEETRVILLVPYFIALGTLQIRQEHTPNQPFNMELHQKNRKIQLKQAKEYFCNFLNLALQYDQVNDDFLSWVLPITMTGDDEEYDTQTTKKKDKAFEKLMSDRSQMVLRLKSKNNLEKNLFSNIEEMSELEISRLLSSVSLGEVSNKKVPDQLKKKMLDIREYINYCILDTLEQLSSINREEEMLNAVSARPSIIPQQSQYQQSQNTIGNGQPIAHLKATSINDVLNNRGMLSQMGYNMILLPNNNGGGNGNTGRGNKSSNSLQKKAIANQSIQSNLVNNRATREEIKSRVFGSYVPGPTVSLEEFARQECLDMHQRDEKDKQFKQEQSQKKDNDEEDEEELKKKRAWNDWQDDHVKGSGNMRD